MTFPILRSRSFPPPEFQRAAQIGPDYSLDLKLAVGVESLVGHDIVGLCICMLLVNKEFWRSKICFSFHRTYSKCIHSLKCI